MSIPSPAASSFGAPPTGFSSPESKAFTSPQPPVTVKTSGSPESVDRLRKLQDDLDVTRDRLNKMIKERKSKT